LALARIREARANVSHTEAGFFPTLTATGASTTSHYGKNVAAGNKRPSGTSTLNQVNIDASWELDIFGKQRGADESAEAMLASILEDGRAILVSLLGEIAVNYINLRNYQEQLVVQQEIVASWKEYETLRNDLMSSGLLSDIEALPADVSYNKAVTAISQLEASIQTTLNQLCILLGQQPGSLDMILHSFSSVPQTTVAILSNLPGKIIEQRPDVRKAEEALRSANANIGVAEGNLYPSFSLTGLISWGATSLSSLFSPDNLLLSGGPGVSIPIFDFGKLQSQVAAQYALRDQSFIQYKKAILTALQDVENSLITFASGHQNLVHFKKIFEDNELAYKLTQDRHNSGLSSMIDVFQAKFAYLASKQEYIMSIATNSSNFVNVYKALGGGWNTVAVPPSNHSIDVTLINFEKHDYEKIY